MEDLLLTCPHCKTVCTVDDAGDLVAVEQEQLPEGTNRGLGGLKVVEASPDWRRHSELSNLQLEPKRQVVRLDEFRLKDFFGFGKLNWTTAPRLGFDLFF